MKFKNVIPKHNWEDLSIEELVYFGTESPEAIAAVVSEPNSRGKEEAEEEVEQIDQET